MMFQKSSRNPVDEAKIHQPETGPSQDDVETVVGPSVNVEGDFASEGNIIVKGSVAGSVHTSRNLVLEHGGKILANVRAGSARIAGEIKGNIKVKEVLELSSTARVLGDVEVKTLIVEAGALISGRVAMPGFESETKTVRSSRVTAKRPEEVLPSA